MPAAKKTPVPKKPKKNDAVTDLAAIGAPLTYFPSPPSTPTFIFDHLPPRPAQAEALEQVAAAFDSGKRFVMLEGPPGLGKSALGMSLAQHYGGAYVLTVTKQLQEQYQNDFAKYGSKELLGRATFECVRAGANCEIGGLMFGGAGDGSCVSCPYRSAKTVALKAPYTICNYHSYLHNVGVSSPDNSKTADPVRPLLILDEGHETERVLMDYVGVTIDITKLPVGVPRELPGNAKAPIKEFFDYLEALSNQIDARFEGLPAQEKASAGRLAAKLSPILLSRSTPKWERDWVVEQVNANGFTVKPLFVTKYGDLLFRFGKRVLLMSATILDPGALARALGLPKDSWAFIQAPCPFPKENRPIFVGNLPMTKSHKETSWPQMAEIVQRILNHPRHANQKGLILCPSNEMIQYLRGAIKGSAGFRLVPAYGEDRMAKYNQHLSSRDPTVLVASGFWEGVDLKGDASRFQIIPALPRPAFMGQVAERASLDPNWYEWLTICKLIQGIGRSVRTETDYAVTYILDVAFRKHLEKKCGNIIPPWLKEAVTYMD